MRLPHTSWLIASGVPLSANVYSQTFSEPAAGGVASGVRAAR
jgi:hypothetical protein